MTRTRYQRALAGMSALAALTIVGCGSDTDSTASSSTATPTSAAASSSMPITDETSSTVSTTAATAATASTPAEADSPTMATADTELVTIETSTTIGSGTASAAVLAATDAFVATLSSDEQSAVIAERTQENLSAWSNLPDQLFERDGLRMDALTDDQVTAEMAILRAALSAEGYTQVTQIMTADGVLAASGGMNLDFGADHYWIRFIGAPSETDPWTIQFGGHHLALNITDVGSSMTLAPTLWGAQPAFYDDESGTTIEPLAGETNKAFALMDALDADQQTAAILTTPTTEIILGAGKDGMTLAPEGVETSTFTDDQKALLMDLVTEWLSPLNEESAAEKIATAEAELDQMTFAWYGSTEVGNPIYYRIQSPSFIVEFAHQQGQGANAGGVTHIHSIYREIGNDYASTAA